MNIILHGKRFMVWDVSFTESGWARVKLPLLSLALKERRDRKVEKVQTSTISPSLCLTSDV